jgi:hypothetical protein
MKPILCVVDLTPEYRDVVEIAAMVASAWEVPLIILYSYRLVDLGRGADVRRLKDWMDTKANTSFNELFASLLTRKKVSFEFQSEIGFISDRIHTYIDRQAVGMVVIGETQANQMDEHRSLTLREFVGEMKLPFLIVPQQQLVPIQV